MGDFIKGSSPIGQGAVLPATLSTMNNIPIYADGTGAMVKDSGVAISTDSSMSANSDMLISSQKALVEYIAPGWIPSNETWSYSSSSYRTGNISILGDKTSKYSKGMKLRLVQYQPLTAYWPLTSDTNSTVGSFNGTPTDVTFTSGKFGTAATFNGTSSTIIISDSPALKPLADFTIKGSIKISAGGTVFSSASQNTNLAGIYIQVNPITHTLEFITANNTGVSTASTLACITHLDDNIAHAFVVTFKDNIGCIYIDGLLEASMYMMSPVYTEPSYCQIGAYSPDGLTNTAFITGQVSDLAIDNGFAWDEQTVIYQYKKNVPQGVLPITCEKHFIISTDPEYQASYTLLRCYGGTDFTLTNSVITSTFYSLVQQPVGFNRNPQKWDVSVYLKDVQTIVSPTITVWYPIGSIIIPPGDFILSYAVNPDYTKEDTDAVLVSSALSSVTNTVSNLWLYARTIAGGLVSGQIEHNRKDNISFTSEQTMYLLLAVSSPVSTLNVNYGGLTLINAKCSLV